MFLQQNSAGWEKDKKKHSKTDNRVKLKGSKCHLLEESTPFSVNILLKYIFAVKKDGKCIYSDLPLILLSMYNNDHQDGGNGLIPPQIQKPFFWRRCRHGAHFGNAVGCRVLAVKARPTR